MMQLSNELVFNSIHDLCEALDNSKHQDGRYDSSSEHRGSDWCDTSTYEEARMFLENGKMYDDLGTDINSYRTKGHATKRINKLDVVGHNVVVPLYLQGIPTCMITNKKVINNKIVNIFYSLDAPSYVSNRELIEGASRVFKNILSLEEEGYRVNLYVLQCQEDKYGWALKLKTDREIFNPIKMCFPLVSSSMLRRIGFRIKENLYKDWIGGGYGCAVFYRSEYEKFIKKHFGITKFEIWNYEGKK